MKKVNKMRLAEYIETISGVKVSLEAMFDVQIKRIHEYKRQLMNILGIIHRYDCIKNMDNSERRRVVPRVCIIGGKAAPGYEIAKKIIKLCHAVADIINNDSDVGDLLKLVFIPDYNVTVAELVIPGSDLSQHISTAGHEASGTGSMKFLMNGCLLLATADGSTIEIAQEIGADNMVTIIEIPFSSVFLESNDICMPPISVNSMVSMALMHVLVNLLKCGIECIHLCLGRTIYY
nr:glycogen phosphorylase 1-like [Ipomoea batatas]